MATESVVERNILLLGITGSGKTSLVDLFQNISEITSQNPEWVEYDEDDDEFVCSIDKNALLDMFRPYHAVEDNAQEKTSMESQTEKCVCYDNVCLFDNNYQIIDTPGLGDTQGQAKDVENMNRIVESVKTLGTVQAIFLVMNGTEARATPFFRVAVQRLAQIIPVKIQDILYIVMTNCKSINANLKVSDLDVGIEDVENIEDRILYLDNPYCIWETLSGHNNKKIKDSKKKKMIKKFPQLCADVIGDASEFFTKIVENVPRRTNDMVTAHQKRQTLDYKLDVAVGRFRELDQKKQHLENLKSSTQSSTSTADLDVAINRYRNSTYWTNNEGDDSGRKNTICMKEGCNSNCHAPCYLPIIMDNGSNAFQYCASFSSRTWPKCTDCKCDVSYHRHNRLKWSQLPMGNIFNSTEQTNYNRQNDVNSKKTIIYNAIERIKDRLEEEKSDTTAGLKADANILSTEVVAKSYFNCLVNKAAYAKVLTDAICKHVTTQEEIDVARNQLNTIAARINIIRQNPV